jgi:hypothetical protein
MLSAPVAAGMNIKRVSRIFSLGLFPHFTRDVTPVFSIKMVGTFKENILIHTNYEKYLV